MPDSISDSISDSAPPTPIRDLSNFDRKLFIAWVLAPLVAFLVMDSGNFIGYFPSMLVHEIGHMTFSILSGIPAISFFFASFSLANAPEIGFVIIMAVFELLAIWICWQRRLILLPLLGVIALLTHIFFQIKPTWAVPFLIFGGVAGEFVLPLVLLCFLLEVQRIREIRGLIAFAIASVVFWRSAMNWTMAWLGRIPIPYPRDSAGGISLFANPFEIANGAPVGDTEKLVQIYKWTEAQIVQSYVLLAICCVLVFSLLWGYAKLKSQNPQLESDPGF